VVVVVVICGVVGCVPGVGYEEVVGLVGVVVEEGSVEVVVVGSVVVAVVVMG
jgi:hypothetical protein